MLQIFKYFDSFRSNVNLFSTDEVRASAITADENNFITKFERLKVVQQNKKEIGDFHVKGLNEPEFDAMSDIS